MSIKPKLIVYEINELTLKLLNYYLSINPNGGFGKLIRDGHLMSTICTNKGELHPYQLAPFIVASQTVGIILTISIKIYLV